MMRVTIDVTFRDWTESQHPRGQPENAGEFASAGHTAAPKKLSLAGMKKIGGQLGSNPGGKYEHDGKQYYVKISKSADHAKNELLAAKLYQAAGSPVLDVLPIDANGKQGTATEWKKVTPINRSNAGERREAQQEFATHAWLSNWDAVGLEFDNQGKIDGKMHTLDVGGSLLYRAQGGPKGSAFGDKVTEWDTMRNPSNHQAHTIYGSMTEQQLRESAQKVVNVSDAKIRDLVEQYGPGDKHAKEELAKRLIARRQDIARRVAK